MTTKPSEFVECFKKPRPVGVNGLSCFVICPAIAVALANMLNLSPELFAGMVLLGSVNGGSTSNLCALIAGGDVPLSVLMTTSTTLIAAVITPLLCKVLIGTVVPVDAFGMLLSAVQVVLVPVFLGVGVSSVVPKMCATVQPIIPALGVAMGVLAIGAIVAGNAGVIRAGGVSMHLAICTLHLMAGVVGYFLSVIAGGAGEKEHRTVALETAMKNCAFATVLATAHFEDVMVRAPAAASCIWCPMLASLVAVYWKTKPPLQEGSIHAAWTNNYKA